MLEFFNVIGQASITAVGVCTVGATFCFFIKTIQGIYNNHFKTNLRNTVNSNLNEVARYMSDFPQMVDVCELLMKTPYDINKFRSEMREKYGKENNR